MEYTKIIRGKAAPDKVEAVKKAAVVLARDGNSDPGSIHYAIYQSEDDPTLFTVFSRWKSEADFARYIESNYHEKFVKSLPEGAWDESPKSTVLNRL